MPHVGAPLKRPDDPRLLTGRFGVMITDQPITAERVVRAVREGGRRRGR